MEYQNDQILIFSAIFCWNFFFLETSIIMYPSLPRWLLCQAQVRQAFYHNPNGFFTVCISNKFLIRNFPWDSRWGVLKNVNKGIKWAEKFPGPAVD